MCRLQKAHNRMTLMDRLHFEDFLPGKTMALGRTQVTRDAMIDFAAQFDPQPFHLDETAATLSFAGGLIASGWHTAAMLHRQLCDAFLLNSTCLGSPGVETLKWLRPVKAGDVLTGTLTVLESRISASKPDRGIVRFQLVLNNQNGAPVLEETAPVLFSLRRPGKETGRRTPASPPKHPTTMAGDTVWLTSLPMIDDIHVNSVMDLGSYTFTPQKIIDFAEKFDNQPFHLSEEAGRNSLFGGLAASGWHTGSSWMRGMALSRQSMVEEMKQRGQTPAKIGTSPGFKNMRWLKPVLAGDTLNYYSRIAETRLSVSRPGWGVITHENSAVNQRGETVFEFTGAVFWESRQP